jgi:hypothetical protein
LGTAALTRRSSTSKHVELAIESLNEAANVLDYNPVQAG